MGRPHTYTGKWKAMVEAQGGQVANLVKQLGCNRSTWRRWANGETQPTGKWPERLAWFAKCWEVKW